jgi:hypothetical protein
MDWLGQAGIVAVMVGIWIAFQVFLRRAGIAT